MKLLSTKANLLSNALVFVGSPPKQQTAHQETSKALVINEHMQLENKFTTEKYPVPRIDHSECLQIVLLNSQQVVYNHNSRYQFDVFKDDKCKL